MKRNYIVATILVFPIIALFFWVISVNVTMNRADTVFVKVTGYDPRDLLSGHYVVLRPVWGETDCTQFKNDECPSRDFEYSYRFYLPEGDAKYLDRVISRQSDLDMYLLFATPSNGKPLVKDLYINGLQWKIWLDKNPEPKEPRDRRW